MHEWEVIATMLLSIITNIYEINHLKHPDS